MPPQEGHHDEDASASISLDHAAVLKRFEEIASYPFQLPQRAKPKGRGERVDLKSSKNMKPLLGGLLRFFAKVASPPLSAVLAGLGYLTSGLASS
eukprot:CAMPEP_0113581530 /NCGR_PEP_ID=MMETSP0015_2-20120614/31354_1 /TAXON_ID=2838 /ORGANISM="Odontella" /LENGTH=94 /DNA_ID=CAMNT_0000485989 /DNA_START=103 /DNA_END=383 /DNA_ORIENTATION=- /assembly_acc=CAM_ASM_000160